MTDTVLGSGNMLLTKTDGAPSLIDLRISLGDSYTPYQMII
jgi:hypothetical protein